MPKLTIMGDQIGITNKKVIDVSARMTPHEILCDAFEVIDPRSISIVIEGKNVKLPEFNEQGDCVCRGDEDIMTSPIGHKDMIVICEMKGIDPFTLFVIVAISVLTAVYAYSMMPSTPTLELDSTNNSFNGQRNRARLYSAIPDIYGQFRSYPDLMTAEPYSFYSNSNRMIEQYHVIGYGSYLIEDSRVGSSLIDNAPNHYLEIFEPDENGITNLGLVVSQTSVKAVGSPELRRLNSVPDTIGSENGPVIDQMPFTFVGNVLTFKVYLYRETVLYDFFTSFTNEAAAPFTMNGNVNGTSINGSYLISTIEKGFEINPDDTGSSLIPSPFVEVEMLRPFDSNPFWDQSAPSSGDVNVTFLSRINSEIVGPYDTGIPGTAIQFDLQFLGGVNTYGNEFIEFQVDIFRIDKPGGVVVDSTNYGYTTIKVTGPNSGSIKKKFISFSYGVPLGYYRFTIQRITVESENADQQSVCTLEKVSVLNYHNITLNNMTVARLKINNFTSNLAPDENLFNCLVTRKTITYDTETGTIVDTLAPSRSIADCVLHMHHKVFQRPLDQIDLDGLYEINNRISRTAPALMEVSASFDDIDMPLGDRIKLACNTGRITPYIEFGVYRFTRDERKAPVGLICARDMAKERNYSRVFNPSFPSSNIGVSVEYIDPETNKKVSVNRIFDSEGNIIEGQTINMVDVKLNLCRNREQAINRAIFECQKMIDESFVISDTVLRQGNAYDIGDVIRYADIYLDDVKGGEVVSIDRENDTVYLSEKIPGQSPEYVISYTDRYGRIQGPFEFAQGASNTSIVMAPADMQSMYSPYLETRQLGSRFIISKVESQKEELFKIVEKRPRENGNVELKMIQYRDIMFDFENYINLGLSIRQITTGYGLQKITNAYSAEISAFNSRMFMGLTGEVIYSDDDGVIWQETAGDIGFTEGARRIMQITSHNGSQIIVALSGARAARSVDGGANWTILPRYLGSGLTEADEPPAGFVPIEIVQLISNSNDGLTVVALLDDGASSNGQSISVDGGATWAPMNVPGVVSYFDRIAIDESGNKMFATGSSFYFISTDRAATWTTYNLEDAFPGLSSTMRRPESIACSTDMVVIAILTKSGYVSVSFDSGLTWTLNPVRNLNSGSPISSIAALKILVSNDGKKMFAVFREGYAAQSNDFGQTWGPVPRYLNTENNTTNVWAADMSITGDRVLCGFEIGVAAIADWETE